MDSPSDAEVIGRSLDEPEAFGLVYDRHAATVLRFLGRRVGAEAAETEALDDRPVGFHRGERRVGTGARRLVHDPQALPDLGVNPLRVRGEPPRGGSCA